MPGRDWHYTWGNALMELESIGPKSQQGQLLALVIIVGQTFDKTQHLQLVKILDHDGVTDISLRLWISLGQFLLVNFGSLHLLMFLSFLALSRWIQNRFVCVNFREVFPYTMLWSHKGDRNLDPLMPLVSCRSAHSVSRWCCNHFYLFIMLLPIAAYSKL